MNNLSFVYQQAKESWYRLRVQPVCYDGEGQIEVCGHDEADFYSVYMGTPDGRWMCIADLPTQELAIDLSQLIINLCKQTMVKKFEIGDMVEFINDVDEDWKNVPFVAPIEEIDEQTARMRFSKYKIFQKPISEIKHVLLLID